MKEVKNIFSVAIFCVLLCFQGLAQEPQPEPEKAQEEIEHQAKVLEKDGEVEAKTIEEPVWFPVKIGMLFKKGAEIMTGIASRALLELVQNIRLEVKSISHIKIEDLVLAMQKLQTTVKVDFGKISTEVEKGPISAALRVSAINSTTLIRGTQVEISCHADTPPSWQKGLKIGWEKKGGPWQHVNCQEGQVEIQNPDTGSTITIGAGESTSNELVNSQSFASESSNYQSYPTPQPETQTITNSITQPPVTNNSAQAVAPESTTAAGMQTGETAVPTATILPEPPEPPY